MFIWKVRLHGRLGIVVCEKLELIQVTRVLLFNSTSNLISIFKDPLTFLFSFVFNMDMLVLHSLDNQAHHYCKSNLSHCHSL